MNKNTKTYKIAIPEEVIDKVGWKIDDDVFLEITEACASHSCSDCCPGSRDTFHEDSLWAITIHRVGDLTHKERKSLGFTSPLPHFWDCPCCTPALEEVTNG